MSIVFSFVCKMSKIIYLYTLIFRIITKTGPYSKFQKTSWYNIQQSRVAEKNQFFKVQGSTYNKAIRRYEMVAKPRGPHEASARKPWNFCMCSGITGGGSVRQVNDLTRSPSLRPQNWKMSSQGVLKCCYSGILSFYLRAEETAEIKRGKPIAGFAYDGDVTTPNG